MIVPLPMRDVRETPRPPVRRFRFPIRTRWLIVTLREHASWGSYWRDLRYLVRG